MRAVPKCLVAVAASALATAVPCLADRLPVRAYGAADGLATNKIVRVFQDSRGFLWLGTLEGLWRFDGRSFRRFGSEDGLPGESVGAIAETAGGDLWIGTDRGLCRAPAGAVGGPAFENFSWESADAAPAVSDLAVGRDGALWIATSNGLYRSGPGVLPPVFRPVNLSGVFGPERRQAVNVIHAAADGALMGGAMAQVFVLDGEGRFLGTTALPDRDDTANAFAEERDGTLWIGTRVGVARLVRNPAGLVERFEFVRAAPKPWREPSAWTNQLVVDRRGHLWAAGFGLAEIDPHARGGPAVRAVGPADGLPCEKMESILEDHEGNLWAGSQSCGLIKLERSGLVSFGPADGLPLQGVGAIVEDRLGHVCSIGRIDRWACLEGDRFVATSPAGTGHLSYLGWSWNQTAAQDLDGEWWLAAGGGLLRYPPLARAADLATTPPRSTHEGHPLIRGRDVFRVYRDSRGDVWVGLIASGGSEIVRWDRKSDTLHPVRAVEGTLRGFPSCFAEDREGRIWVASLKGTLSVAEHDALRTIALPGVPGTGGIAAMTFDRKGRLWLATSSAGLWRIDAPDSGGPRVARYGRNEGLASNITNAVAEGPDDRIYVGTISGLEVLAPETGRRRRYTTADGLPNDWITTLLRDRGGRLWIGTDGGLSRFEPSPEEAQPPPPVLVTSLTVNGRPRPVSPRGDSEIRDVEVGPGDNSVEIVAAGLGFAPGEHLRFQHRLGDDPWSAPSDSSSVTYATAAPGRHRAEIRAVRVDGTVSASPAVVSFRVRPPFWRTGWFVAMLAATTLAAAIAMHRLRVARIVATERLRTRVATDLHDDVGSTLSQIALQSEVALASLERGPGDPATALERIAANAREVVESMGDVVWAVDPRHDALSDLARRIREFALAADGAEGMAIRLDLPSDDRDLKIGADLRRQVYLVFKESLTNALRHSGASRVEVTLRTDSRRLELSVADDGRGFEPEDARHLDGHGIGSLRDRAAACGGSIAFEARPGGGTLVRLSVPVR